MKYICLWDTLWMMLFTKYPPTKKMVESVKVFGIGLFQIPLYMKIDIILVQCSFKDCRVILGQPEVNMLINALRQINK